MNSNNNSNNNNNNNYNNNNNNNNNKFLIIWNNIYLRNHIIKYLKLYNMYYNKNDTEYESFKKSNNKEYYYHISINLNKEYGNLSLKWLPYSIESISLIKRSSNQITPSSTICDIPHSINTLSISYESVSLLSRFKSLVNLTLEFESGKYDSIDGLLPNTIMHLKLLGYKKKLNMDLLPNRLVTLHHLSNSHSYFSFGHLKIDSILSSLTELKINYYYYSIIHFNQLQNTCLKKLILINHQYEFKNDSDTKLPETLEYLTLHCKDLTFKLPSKLVTLNLQAETIKENVLPDSIINLELVITSNQKLNHKMIPRQLKHLKIENNSNLINQLSNIKLLPDTLETLEFIKRNSKFYFNQKLIPNQFPSGLLVLKFEYGFNNGTYNNSSSPLIDEDLFPPSLTVLDFGVDFTQCIGVKTLPSNLKHLKLGGNYNDQIIEGTIPSGCTLELLNSNYSHHPIEPNNQSVNVKLYGYDGYQNKYEMYPERVKSITTGVYFESTLSSLSLMDKTNLEYIEFSHYYNKELNITTVPSNNKIKTITVGRHFKSVIDLSAFQHLETIIVKNKGGPIIKSEINSNDQHQFYSLKTIIVNIDNINYIETLDPIFIQFIKLVNKDPK